MNPDCDLRAIAFDLTNRRSQSSEFLPVAKLKSATKLHLDGADLADRKPAAGTSTARRRAQ